uniref:Remorin_C domain-containing protein n=1 Tax=Caenorhabditis tropicalis TaxID=1561998 RepID=A0A1I7UA49_9PELO
MVDLRDKVKESEQAVELFGKETADQKKKCKLYKGINQLKYEKHSKKLSKMKKKLEKMRDASRNLRGEYNKKQIIYSQRVSLFAAQTFECVNRSSTSRPLMHFFHSNDQDHFNRLP